MKWIGQHIWDFISRFRSDVYLEATETGTIASGGNLGLDSNNKIVKANTESGELSFTGSTANGVLTYLDADSIQVEPNWYYDGSTDLATFTSSDASKPIFSFVNTHSGASGGQLRFQRTTAGSDDDALGYILFHGSNAASELTSFAQIVGGITTAANTDEAGELDINIAASDGFTSNLQTGLRLFGSGADNTVSANIGYGANSTTRIIGSLTMGSTSFASNTGLIMVAAQTNITSLGTLTNLQVDDVNINTKSIEILGDTSDTFNITTGAAGATTLTTVDAGGEDGHITFAADGDIFFKPDSDGEIHFLQSDGDVQVRIDPNSNSSFYNYGRGTYIGPESDASADVIRSTAPHDTEGGMLNIYAGSTTADTTNNIAGGNLTLNGGAGKGTGIGGSISLRVAPAGTSGSSLNSYITPIAIDHTGKVTITPANISGDAFHLDADAGPDNVVNIDAGILDVDATGNITINSSLGNIAIATANNHFYTTIDRRKFTITSSTDDDYNGDVIYTGSGTTTLGNIIYLRTNNTWANAEADSEDATKGVLGIALGTDPATDGVLIKGMYTLDHDVGDDQGVPIYLSATAGEATATIPSTGGHFVRILGYNMGDDDQIWFDPDKTYIEIAS